MNPGKNVTRQRITFHGLIQGIGFRPFIYRLAKKFSLSGWIKNNSAGVVLEWQGPERNLEDAWLTLKNNPLPLAELDTWKKEVLPPLSHETRFNIQPSLDSGRTLLSIPPDLAICQECAREMDDPKNRRFRYPFINCTQCGPRFTILDAVPYDRQRTSMRHFALCADCQNEYQDPLNRRFEAQPNACPVCGPRLHWWENGAGADDDPLVQALTRLEKGAIVAIKGVGGYHLAAYPLHPAAVPKLRVIKNRDQQALALMVKSLEQAAEICEISASAAVWLSHPAAPIVICPRKPGIAWAHSLSPDTHDLGLFLPYSPLHRLLLNALSPLVMTSANLRDEPILYDESAPQRLCSELTPYVLGHNREIVRPCDDSLLALADTLPLFFRRSRGFVPRPLPFSENKPGILAFGSDRKNTFCLTQENHAYVSQHLGDLSSPRTLEHYRSEISNWCDFLNVRPAWWACDMHPEYFSTQEALRSSAANRLLRIQHHHAHLAAVLGEHKLTSPVLGVAWDGTGYGPDETLWGGEFFQLTRAHCQRLASFQLIPLPGGEAAIHTPWKTALGLLHANGMPPDHPGLAEIFSSHSDLLPPLRRLLELPELSPRSSGAGRLFDAVAACLGFDLPSDYEGQAAIWLQTLCHNVPLSAPPFPFDLKEDGALWRLHWAPMLEALAQNLSKNTSRPLLAARFHATLAEALLQTLIRLRDQTGLNQVVFSGGVFQNTRLIQLIKNRLPGEGFMLYWHLQLPPNDGCLSFGQAIVAAELLTKD